MQDKKKKGTSRKITTPPSGKARGTTRHSKSPYVKAQRAKGAAAKGSGKKVKRNDWWAAPVSALMILILASVAYFGLTELKNYVNFNKMRNVVDSQRFYSGITVEGTDVSQMTLDQALSLWAEREEEVKSRMNLTLEYEGQSWTLSNEQLGYSSNYEQVLKNAYALGRSGSLEERYAEINSLANNPQSLSIERGYDEEKLKQQLNEVASQVNKEGSNATIASFNSDTGEFTFKEGVTGRVVDMDKLYSQAQQALASGSTSLTIETQTVEPTVTVAQLQSEYGKITTAVTDASSSSSNRITNIKLALKAMDGLRLDPGEKFSFNELLGERTKAKGYKEAGVINNGMMDQGVGGGICQVSTTLFNAVAKADLKITERHPHSRPSTYVDLGKDAAVNWPNQDFCFVNNTDTPIYISAKWTSKKKVSISIYGKKLADGMSIKITSKQTATVDPGDPKITVDSSLPSGTRKVVSSERKGYKATTYKVYLDKNGNEIKRVELCKSNYPAAKAVIKVGK